MVPRCEGEPMLRYLGHLGLGQTRAAKKCVISDTCEELPIEVLVALIDRVSKDAGTVVGITIH